MAHFPRFRSVVVPLLADNVDTDQIIPARFLKVTDRSGLGKGLFADWRYEPDGAPRKEFVLNKPAYRGAQILLAGHNFGCGSSREHAPWALKEYGFRAIISTSFADIFRNNALKNGLLPVEVTQEVHQLLVTRAASSPSFELGVDLEQQAVEFPDATAVHFPIDGFSKHCLLNGVDELEYLLSFNQEIQRYESEHAVEGSQSV
jgi:3-isopropylmalate/(R)-2-methylmalate dehydratase small subunit